MLILSATLFKSPYSNVACEFRLQLQLISSLLTEVGLQYASPCSVFQARNGPEARGLLPRAARCPTGDLFPGEFTTLVAMLVFIQLKLQSERFQFSNTPHAHGKLILRLPFTPTY